MGTNQLPKIRKGIRRLTFVACFLLISNFSAIAHACPTCKNDLQHSGSEFGFAVSILFMMAAPFCIFAGWTVIIYRLRRQMKLEHNAIAVPVESNPS